MKLTIDKLNELHVIGKISDMVYDQYSTLLINDENIELHINHEGTITFRVKLQDY